MGPWAPLELVSAALRGDAVAAEDLIRTIWPRCFRLAATLVGDLSLAQDAAQEACIIVHHKLAGLEHVQAFDSWLYRIVLRESNRVRRRNAPLKPPIYGRGFGGELDVSIDVWRALGHLPPVFRDVTVLHYFDDLKSDEIASILNIPHATVRTRLARARERLRGLLHDYANDPQLSGQEVKHHAL